MRAERAARREPYERVHYSERVVGSLLPLSERARKRVLQFVWDKVTDPEEKEG